MRNLPDPAAWGLPDCAFEILKGGHRARVLRGSSASGDWVFKTTTRTEAQLAWLKRCAEFAQAAGMEAVVPHRTLDGTFSHAGWTAEPYVASRSLQAGERGRFRAMLRRLHKTAFGLEQRPGFLNARALLHDDRGGDIDFTAMPAPLVQRCRSAFAAIPSAPLTLVHGDLNPANVGVKPSGHIVVYDWDEARVDHPLFDMVAIGALHHGVPHRVATAFEVATCWKSEPERAMSLAERFW